jgi:hypothetical protein
MVVTALQRKMCVHKMLLYLDKYKQLDLISCKYEIVFTVSLYTDILTYIRVSVHKPSCNWTFTRARLWTTTTKNVYVTNYLYTVVCVCVCMCARVHTRVVNPVYITLCWDTKQSVIALKLANNCGTVSKS